MLQFVSFASVTEHLWEDYGSVFPSCPLGSQRQQLSGSWGLQLPQRHFCYVGTQQEWAGDAGGRLVLGAWVLQQGKRAEVQKVMFLQSALPVKEMHNSSDLLFLCDCNDMHALEYLCCKRVICA